MAVHLIQLLCPERHALIALAYEVGSDGMGDKARLRRLKHQWAEMIASGAVNPWCGICGSRELRYETAVTRWDTLEQAAPSLKEEERRNALARAVIDQGRSRDN